MIATTLLTPIVFFFGLISILGITLVPLLKVLSAIILFIADAYLWSTVVGPMMLESIRAKRGKDQN